MNQHGVASHPAQPGPGRVLTFHQRGGIHAWAGREGFPGCLLDEPGQPAQLLAQHIVIIRSQGIAADAAPQRGCRVGGCGIGGCRIR